MAEASWVSWGGASSLWAFYFVGGGLWSGVGDLCLSGSIVCKPTAEVFGVFANTLGVAAAGKWVDDRRCVPIWAPTAEVFGVFVTTLGVASVWRVVVDLVSLNFEGFPAGAVFGVFAITKGVASEVQEVAVLAVLPSVARRSCYRMLRSLALKNCFLSFWL